MKCLGINNKRKRCGRETKFLVCYYHLWQLISAFIVFIGLIAAIITISDKLFKQRDPQDASQLSTHTEPPKIQLINKIENATDKKVGCHDYYDYDGDGEKELFAVIGDPLDLSNEDDWRIEWYHERGISTTSEELWFASSKKIQRLKRSENIELGNCNWNFIIELFGIQTVFSLCEYNTSYFWSVQNGIPKYHSEVSGKIDYVHFTGTAFPKNEEHEIIFTRSYYVDALHTFQLYWFYWDKESCSIKEYGAKEITEYEFCQFNGGQDILEKIKADNQKVKNILYRANGIVNINYTSGNTTIALRNGYCYLFGENFDSISSTDYSYEDSNTFGIYLTAFMPEIATYPD